MSNVAVEHPRAFPTTVGFRVQGGFELPVQPAPPQAAAPVVAHACSSSTSSSFVTTPQQPSRLSMVSPQSAEVAAVARPAGLLLRRDHDSLHVPFSSSLASSAPLHEPALAHPELITALSTGVPEAAKPVGWKGLLEFSETSGCSGVLGPKTTSEDLDTTLNRDCKIEICCTAHPSTAVRSLVKSVIRGLRACQEPDKAMDGMGGTYFFSNEAGKKVAILKPCDEEPLAPNNPKGYVGRQLGDPGWKPTVRVGEAAIREVAACLLDHDGWARVPTSVLVRARHPVFCYQAQRNAAPVAPPTPSLPAPPVAPGGSGLTAAMSRAASQANLEGAECAPEAPAPSPTSPGSTLPMKLGSLQEFVSHECDTSEMGPGRFSVRDVHRIGVLDVRLFNTDRHAGNMLVRRPRMASSSTADLKSRMVTADAPYELIPIDHGFCLPETLEAPYFEWLHWPQTMLPFSDDELEYIRALDVERDKSILRQELPMLRPECLRVLEVCTTLLKTCAEAGLTLFDIASVMTRPFVDSDEEPSELERMCAYARQCVEYAHEMTQCCDGDIESSESDSEAAAEELQLELEIMHETLGVPTALTRATISSIKEEGDEMLFCLDDESGKGVPYMPKRRVGFADGVSSQEDSPCSSLSTAEGMSLPAACSATSYGLMDGFSLADGSSSPAAPAGSSALAISAVAGSSETPLRQAGPPMASSAHVTDGFLWRKLKGQRTAAAKGGALSCPRRGRVGAAMYPPPVAAFSPERMSACFSGMDEAQWEQFMEVLRAQIQAGLESGRWRQSTADLAAGMALSCPRF
ncbi:hypothetical protein GPECTOR_62g895 [Gonium pectorale]|uniref:1-phosphatidylinositol 4-kinase n=1 Tax=Gonium pectorale TaxID=33097 RepID=A0A150G627_GONPE|nr:hypothetical protein GPECTOR_62g895 [Gonium pectorale]|eukprot:KXZ44780.1 hypothetical protein GPECTOR_62g895 [Gonium pectorale]